MKKLSLVIVMLIMACNNREMPTERLATKRSPIIKIKVYSNSVTNTHKNIFDAAKASQKKYLRYVKNKRYIGIVNYNIPYTRERFWIYDIKQNKVIFRSRVSHAYHSGKRYAYKFSNKPNSYLSPKGSFVTLNTFDGTYGYSMRIKGLERGINDNSLKRGIIFHPANGMTHSGGCFMLPDLIAEETFDKIKNGTLIYVHRT